MGIIPEILRKTAPPHSPTMVKGAGPFLRSRGCSPVVATCSAHSNSSRPDCCPRRMWLGSPPPFGHVLDTKKRKPHPKRVKTGKHRKTQQQRANPTAATEKPRLKPISRRGHTVGDEGLEPPAPNRRQRSAAPSCGSRCNRPSSRALSSLSSAIRRSMSSRRSRTDVTSSLMRREPSLSESSASRSLTACW